MWQEQVNVDMGEIDTIVLDGFFFPTAMSSWPAMASNQFVWNPIVGSIIDQLSSLRYGLMRYQRSDKVDPTFWVFTEPKCQNICSKLLQNH